MIYLWLRNITQKTLIATDNETVKLVVLVCIHENMLIGTCENARNLNEKIV